MAGTGTAHLGPVDDGVLRVEDLVVRYPTASGRRAVDAVSGISFDVRPGETLGLVGESGCGKTSTGRAIMQIPPPAGGSVRFEGRELTEMGRRELRRVRTGVQMVFQNPISALNPRRTVRDSVLEPLRIWRRDGRDTWATTVDSLLDEVGIDPHRAARSRPHQLSGGQCQRISIAQALVLRPRVLICDEPVSALDVGVQAQILSLIRRLKTEHDLSLVFIAHDLAVVKNMSDRIAVMYLGKMCEVAPASRFERRAVHPYTQTLLDAVPVPDPKVRPRATRPGEPPSPLDPPAGCRFHTRCPLASARCHTEEPQMRRLSPDHYVACHHPGGSAAAEPERIVTGG